MINMKLVLRPVEYFNKQLPIKDRIFLYSILVIIVSLFAVGYLSNKVSTNAIIDKAQRSNERELALVSNNLDTYVENIDNYSITLSIDYRLIQILKNINKSPDDSALKYNSSYDFARVATAIKGLNNNISSCDVMTLDFSVLDVGNYSFESVSPHLSKSLIDYAIKNQAPVWSGPYKIKNKYGGMEDIFIITKSVVDLNSPQLLGVTIMYIKERGIASTYTNNTGKTSASMYILDQNNKIVSSSVQDCIYKQFEKIGGVDKKLLNELVSKKMIVTKIGEKPSLVTLQNFSMLNWKIITVVPIEEITSEVKVINKLIFYIGMICLIFAFITSYLLSRSISKPILKLVNIMKYIKQGNMDIRTDFNSSDEIGILGSGFNSLMDKIKELMDKIILEQKAKREYEFQLIQSQINPHFLYNTLETISSFIKLGMKDNALSSIQHLSSFYRISLSDGKDIISVAEEMELINSYLTIQRFRYIKYVDFVIDFDKSILTKCIPKLTLQPLVENAIYHGLKPKKEKSCLMVKGMDNNDSIIIEVYDSGVGMTEEKISEVLKPQGMQSVRYNFGLNSVDARIKLLFGTEFGLSIESEPGKYTRVTIRLPKFET